MVRRERKGSPFFQITITAERTPHQLQITARLPDASARAKARFSGEWSKDPVLLLHRPPSVVRAEFFGNRSCRRRSSAAASLNRVDFRDRAEVADFGD